MNITDLLKCRIVSAEPVFAERLIDELWKDYQLLSVNILQSEGKPWVIAVMIHRGEIPRQPSPIAVPIAGFRQ